MKAISFDESRWPLVIVTYPEQTEEADFFAHLDLLDANIRRTVAARAKTALIYDITSGYRAPASVRKAQADWMKKNATVTRQNCVGIAFVMTSAVVRGALTAILWMSDMPAPYTVVATVEEAERWCTEKLGAHGVTVPPKARRAAP